MTVESDDLAILRETTSKTLLALLWLHIPIAMAIGMARGTGWLMPTAVMVAMALAATLSWRTSGNGLSTRLIFAVALMGSVSVFTFQLAGHAWQVDMHMYFFATLACLLAYCDYRPILAGAVAVALHHLVLNFLLPAAVYPGGADLGRVVLHAFILLIEAGVLSWLAVKLSGLFETTAQKTAEAEAASAAEARANIDRMTAERQAKQDSDAARRELAAGFERKIGSIVEAVAVTANEVQGLSTSMSKSNAETTRQTAEAAAASTRASSNVETVAAATEELTASISNIAQQVTRSAEIANKAAEEARRTNSVVEGACRRHPEDRRSGDADPEHRQPRRWPIRPRKRRRKSPRRCRTSRPLPAKPSAPSRQSAAPSPRSTKSPVRSPPPSISRAQRRGRSRVM